MQDGSDSLLGAEGTNQRPKAQASKLRRYLECERTAAAEKPAVAMGDRDVAEFGP